MTGYSTLIGLWEGLPTTRPESLIVTPFQLPWHGKLLRVFPMANADAEASRMNQYVARPSLRNPDVASNTIKREAASVAHVMMKDQSTPVSLIGRAVKFPAMPVHQ